MMACPVKDTKFKKENSSETVSDEIPKIKKPVQLKVQTPQQSVRVESPELKSRQFLNLQKNSLPLQVVGGKVKEREEQETGLSPQYLRYLVDRIMTQLNLTAENVDMVQLEDYIKMRLKQQNQNMPKIQVPNLQQNLMKTPKKAEKIKQSNQLRLQPLNNSPQDLIFPIQVNGISTKNINLRNQQRMTRQSTREGQRQLEQANQQSELLSIFEHKSAVKTSEVISQMDFTKKSPLEQLKPKYTTQSCTVSREKPLKKDKKKSSSVVPIYHDVSEVDQRHFEHRINVTVRRINLIVKLIFKNTKESQAITSGSGGNVMVPTNRSSTEDQRFQELNKVIKQMGVQIPKRFDSKANMREYFYSREFILNLKIKMQEQLHQAVLNSNNMPQQQEIDENQQVAGNQRQTSKTNRFWVGLGNNSAVVKSVLKQRYWWQKGASESFDDVDFIWTAWKKQKHIQKLQELQGQVEDCPKLYNKLEQNKQLTNKKGMFINLKIYYEAIQQDPFKVLPLTFHTKRGLKDPEFVKFSNYYQQLERKIQILEHKQQEMIQQLKARYEWDPDEEEHPELLKKIQDIKKTMKIPKNTWIIKPGENTNRGYGIDVSKSLQEIKSIVGRATKGDRTAIIQKYIDNPLLVHKRKFDFRCYGLMTSFNGSLKGYFFEDGYVRTSCKEFSLDDIYDKFVHLTNDAIQVHADDYGKYESGNKLSFADFQKVINAQHPEVDFDMQRDILPQMRKLVSDTFRCSVRKIDPDRLQNSFEVRRLFNFQLFGYDFMLDEDWRLYLIEVNTNPCLDCGCSLLQRIIPDLLDNCFKIVLDPMFPSPDLSQYRKCQLNELPQEIKFTLCFDEDVEGEFLKEKLDKGIPEVEIESDQEQELQEDDELLVDKEDD